MYNVYLAHHGIKGQKWGVRRFQNKDGTLTDAGKKRYASDETNRDSKSASSLFKEKAKGFYKNHEKAIKIGATVAAASLAIYGGYKLYQHAPIKEYGAFSYSKSDPLSSTLDSYSNIAPTIPKNVTFHRISRDAFADYSNIGSTYVTYKFRDNARYVSASTDKWAFPGGARNFIHELTPDRQIKVPSARTVAEVYLKQHPNARDQQFWNVVTNGFIQWDDSYADDPVTKATVEQAKSLRKELLSMGYDAIVDIEDAGGGSGVELPLILLNPSKMSSSAREITKAERVVASFTRRK